MKNDKLRFVIIGTGNISATYYKAAANVADAEIVAAVSRSGRKPAWAPEGFEIADSLENVKAAYDAVMIATPNATHHLWAVAAARLGKHVITEKPLDITIPAMDQMIETCRQCGVKLGVAYQRRLSPDNMIVKELLEQDAFGKVFAADLTVKCYRDQAYYDSAPYRGNKDLDGGGPFIQQASHNVDIYAWFFGKPVKTVSMLATFMHRMEGEDHGVAILKHANGMIGSIIASTAAYPGFPAEMMIHTEKGSLVIKNDIITTWEIKGLPNPSVSANKDIHSGASSAVVSQTGGHEAIITDFIDAVKLDHKPAVSGEDARLATEIILDIYHNNIY